MRLISWTNYYATTTKYVLSEDTDLVKVFANDSTGTSHSQGSYGSPLLRPSKASRTSRAAELDQCTPINTSRTIRVASSTEMRWHDYVGLPRGLSSVILSGWKARWTPTRHHFGSYHPHPCVREVCSGGFVQRLPSTTQQDRVNAHVPLSSLSVMLLRFEMLGGPDGSLMGIVQQRMMNFESSPLSPCGLLLQFPV
jgi:hypothetical protein